MNTTEIEITSLIKRDDFDPYFLSNSRANLGDDAGAITWNNSKALSKTLTQTPPDLLPTEAHEQSFRDFVQDSGGWTEEEISAWDHDTLHTLLVQWIAGDIREAFDDAAFEDWDWDQYEIDAEKGRVSSRIFKGDDGRVYFSISN